MVGRGGIRRRLGIGVDRSREGMKLGIVWGTGMVLGITGCEGAKREGE